MKYLTQSEQGSALKICVAISLVFHLCLLMPWPFFTSIFKPQVSFDKIELTYFMQNQKAEMLIRQIEPITSILNNSKQASVKTESLKEISQVKRGNTPVKPVENKIVKEEAVKPAITDNALKYSAGAKSVEIASDYETHLKKGPPYEKYYMDIRERIKSSIEKNKKPLLKDSEVRVRFVILRDGTLKDIAIQRSQGSDTSLLESLAVKSIKESSPFPPFSKEISENELNFSLPIRVSHRY